MYSPILYQIAVDRNREDQVRAAQARLLPTRDFTKAWFAKVRLLHLFQPNRLRVFKVSAAQS